MPRYSHVVCYPVLIAVCVVVNIHRYPAVSAMLRGEPVASRCLGTSGVFDFQANPSAGAKSYRGYRSDSGPVEDFRASRAPIPLSDSPAAPSVSTALSQSTPSPSSAPSFQFGESSMNANPRTDTGLPDPDYGAYHDGFFRSRSGDRENAGTTSRSSRDRDGYSDDSDPYGSDSYSNTSSGLTDTYTSSTTSFTLFDSYNHGSGNDLYGDFRSDSHNASHASLFPAWNEDRGNIDKPEDRNANLDLADLDDTGYRSESRSSSDHRDSWPNGPAYYNAPENARGSEFRMDSPMPGYSSRYSADDENASTPAAASHGTATETEPAVPQTRRLLSLQEKHELRLATPFALSPSDSQETSSDPYIPPDFLPPHENGVVGKLVDPSAEPTAIISPVTFGSGTLSSDSETTSGVSPEAAVTTSSPETESDSGNEVVP